MSEYVIQFDGSCGPKNPGPLAGWGYTIHKDGVLLVSKFGQCEGQPLFSNNFAEFNALGKALEYLTRCLVKSDKLFIRGDSKLVVNIMRKRWRAKDGLYYPAYLEALETLTWIRSHHIPVSIDWVPRAMNTQADSLSTSYAKTAV